MPQTRPAAAAVPPAAALPCLVHRLLARGRGAAIAVEREPLVPGTPALGPDGGVVPFPGSASTAPFMPQTCGEGGRELNDTSLLRAARTPRPLRKSGGVGGAVGGAEHPAQPQDRGAGEAAGARTVERGVMVTSP